MDAPKTASFFIPNQKPIRAPKMASKRVYEIVLFRPFAKIWPIWSCFKSEPDTGFFWDAKRAIGAQIGPGWDEVMWEELRRKQQDRGDARRG